MPMKKYKTNNTTDEIYILTSLFFAYLNTRCREFFFAIKLSIKVTLR